MVDILLFRKRKIGEPEGDLAWLDPSKFAQRQLRRAIRVNRWFAGHPDFVLGEHALCVGPFGETYTCLPKASVVLEQALNGAIGLFAEVCTTASPTRSILTRTRRSRPDFPIAPGALACAREAFLRPEEGLMQIVEGKPVSLKTRKGRGRRWRPPKSMFASSANLYRSATPCVTCSRPRNRIGPGKTRRSVCAHGALSSVTSVRSTTKVSISEDDTTGEVRETHRRPNLSPFLDDPDCWLVASIEDYDPIPTPPARPIFTERVIARRRRRDRQCG